MNRNDNSFKTPFSPQFSSDMRTLLNFCDQFLISGNLFNYYQSLVALHQRVSLELSQEELKKYSTVIQSCERMMGGYLKCAGVYEHYNKTTLCRKLKEWHTLILKDLHGKKLITLYERSKKNLMKWRFKL